MCEPITPTEHARNGDQRRHDDDVRAHEPALDELCDRYLAPVYRYVRCFVDDTGMAEDITETVLSAGVAQSDRENARDGDLATRLFRLARRHVRAAGSSPGCWARIGGGIARALHGQWSAARALSEPQRQVMALRFAARLSSREAAAVLGISERRVWALQYRALSTLQRQTTDGLVVNAGGLAGER